MNLEDNSLQTVSTSRPGREELLFLGQESIEKSVTLNVRKIWVLHSNIIISKFCDVINIHCRINFVTRASAQANTDDQLSSWKDKVYSRDNATKYSICVKKPDMFQDTLPLFSTNATMLHYRDFPAYPPNNALS